MDNLQLHMLEPHQVNFDGTPAERKALALLIYPAASDQPRCCYTLATAQSHYHPLKAAERYGSRTRLDLDQ